MGGFISIFIVLAALVTMVGVMYLVLTEKHVDESKINYVQSPYAVKPVKPAPAPVSPYPDEQASAAVAEAAPEVTEEKTNTAADQPEA
jgi:hypothetical protein